MPEVLCARSEHCAGPCCGPDSAEAPASNTASGTCSGARDLPVERLNQWEQSLDTPTPTPPHLLLIGFLGCLESGGEETYLLAGKAVVTRSSGQAISTQLLVQEHGESPFWKPTQPLAEPHLPQTLLGSRP